MDSKAFNKIYSEAVEALAERRLSDALSLMKAIFQDVWSDKDTDTYMEKLHEGYIRLLDNYAENRISEPLDDISNELFRMCVSMLELARDRWILSNRTTLYGRMASQMTDLTYLELIDQLKRTKRSHLGREAYHVALDAAFGLSWCIVIHEKEVAPVAKHFVKMDYFARCVVVGGLLMGILDNFTPPKIKLLLELGALADADLTNASLLEDEDERRQMEDNAHDLQARVAVALTLIIQRYKAFLPFFTDLSEKLRQFFCAPNMINQLPALLHAFVCQSLTDRVGKRVDDILPIIKEAFEKTQRHLGPSTDEDGKDNPEDTINLKDLLPDGEGIPSGEEGFMKVTKIEINASNKLFRKMASYAQSVDAMRQSDMDVNFINFSNMKRFDFFDHPAHWFYPFSLDEPTNSKGLHHHDGRLDTLTLGIMDNGRFCASDRYSYAAMMAYLRRDGRMSISDNMRQQIDEMKDDDDDDESLFDDFDASVYRLNPFADYCQCAYRFLHNHTVGDDYSFAFAATDDIILPLLAPFEGLFPEFQQVEGCVEAYLHMGDSEHAIVLLNHFMEHHGATAYALELRGHAYMQQRMWRSAVSDLQQSLLIHEDPAPQLAMARCFEALHDWDSALPLLLKEDLRQESKDPNLIEEIARCLVQLSRWDDAAQRFFQLEFMNTHSSVCQRGIGWCSLHQGKYARAEQYYHKLIDGARNPSWEDYINLGHALWLQGRTSEAVAAYRQFVTIFNRVKKAQRHEFSHWCEAFREDARILLSSRFDAVELALMQDLIALK